MVGLITRRRHGSAAKDARRSADDLCADRVLALEHVLEKNLAVGVIRSLETVLRITALFEIDAGANGWRAVRFQHRDGERAFAEQAHVHKIFHGVGATGEHNDRGLTAKAARRIIYLHRVPHTGLALAADRVQTDLSVKSPIATGPNDEVVPEADLDVHVAADRRDAVGLKHRAAEAALGFAIRGELQDAIGVIRTG